jgi:putative nucleotidyltransferase with HDIG domain
MIARADAYALVTQHIAQPNLVSHCVAAEIIMEALGKRLGLGQADVERWALVGLLHDLDYATTAEDPASHGKVSVELLADVLDAEMLHAILAHAGHTPRESVMDNALWCADPTTGFIVAAALVRPEKDLAGVSVKSLKKRWKEGAFAKGANREQMAGHEELGLEREEFLAISLEAMQNRASEIGF